MEGMRADGWQQQQRLKVIFVHYYMDNSIPNENKQCLKNRMAMSKKPIDALLKQYKYMDDIPHSENMKKLCKCLENVMNVDSLYDFNKYLTNQEQLPIEINFKALKYEKLVEMFEDWLATKEDHYSSSLDRSITHKHRNILFKRILIQEKDTIKDYFQTLSNKKKLKGFDLFQLLTEILGTYFLYQFNADSQTFFEKINSFETFTKIVQSFVKNGVRFYTKDRDDPNDELYVRLHQLQAMIQFWQLVNPELTLQEAPRKNMADASIQTILVNSNSVEVQTDKDSSKGIINIINRNLHDINGLIEAENDPQILTSLDKILEVLRAEKIFLATYHAYRQDKRMQNRNPKMLLSSEYSETEPILPHGNAKPRLFSPTKNRSPQKILPSNILDHSSSQKQEDSIKTIYKYLCTLDKLNCLTIDILHKFFCEVGIVTPNETFLVQKLINYGFIQFREDISSKQFKGIIRQLMKEDRRININLFNSYISTHIQQNSLKRTAYFKNTQSTNRSQGLMNQSLLNRERSFREESRTTFPMDSDGSLA